MRPPHLTFPPPPMRVLIVDDDPDTRVALREMLRIWRHGVCEARDMTEALLMAATFRPDVALVGLGLPDGDGFTLAAQLRTLPGLEQMAVAVLTAGSGEDKLRQAYEAGVQHFLVKPADPILLRRLLGSIRFPAED